MYRITWQLTDQENDSGGPMIGEGERVAQAAAALLADMDNVFELGEMAAADVLEGLAHVAREHWEMRDAVYHHEPGFTMPETAFTLTLAEFPDNEIEDERT